MIFSCNFNCRKCENGHVYIGYQSLFAKNGTDFITVWHMLAQERINENKWEKNRKNEWNKKMAEGKNWTEKKRTPNRRETEENQGKMLIKNGLCTGPVIRVKKSISKVPNNELPLFIWQRYIVCCLSSLTMLKPLSNWEGGIDGRVRRKFSLYLSPLNRWPLYQCFCDDDDDQTGNFKFQNEIYPLTSFCSCINQAYILGGFFFLSITEFSVRNVRWNFSIFKLQAQWLT